MKTNDAVSLNAALAITEAATRAYGDVKTYRHSARDLIAILDRIGGIEIPDRGRKTWKCYFAEIHGIAGRALNEKE